MEYLKKSLRQEMESSVIAYNCFLKNKVDFMTIVPLLRNMHPADRPGFAKRLYQEDKSRYYVREFINID